MANVPYKVRGRPHIVAYDVQTGEVMVQCRLCQTDYHIVKVDPEMMEAWLDGKLIQNVMPHLTKQERELLISGTCDLCWNKLFANYPE